MRREARVESTMVGLVSRTRWFSLSQKERFVGLNSQLKRVAMRVEMRREIEIVLSRTLLSREMGSDE